MLGASHHPETAYHGVHTWGPKPKPCNNKYQAVNSRIGGRDLPKKTLKPV